jgi:outer membrane protein assembly factor BamB
MKRQMITSHWPILLTLIACVAASRFTSVVNAGDWPGILGPQRNGIAAEDEQIADQWPATGPREVWQRPVGEGYAGVAVVGDALFLFHRVGSDEVVERVHARTGKPVWKQSFATGYRSSIAPDNGPRCVPVCDGDAVYVCGAAGQLACLDQQRGKVRWQRNVLTEFDSPEGYFGCGSTPIVVGSLVIVNVGGDNAGIVAFDKQTGKTVWQQTDERASYSSPVLAKWQGQETVVCLTRLNLVGVEPRQGKVLFETPFGARGPTVNAANPIVVDDSILLTASYGIGAVRLKMTESGVTDAWRLVDGLSSQYTTPIVRDGVIYAIDGRQDAGRAHLRALDWETGKVLWTEENFGYATLLWAGGKLLVLTTEGELVLVGPGRDRYREMARHQILTTTTRALPALSQGHLFVRDESVLKCVDVARSK